MVVIINFAGISAVAEWEAIMSSEEEKRSFGSGVGGGAVGGEGEGKVVGLKVYLRDISEAMVAAWEDKEAFGSDTFKNLVEVNL